MDRLTASRARAIGESLHRVDSTTAAALIAHAEWLKDIEHTLREANIQLAAPHLQTTTVVALRDCIDALLEIVPRPQPIQQADED